MKWDEYLAERALIIQRLDIYEAYFREMPWRWWVTLTYSYDVSVPMARLRLDGFREEWEASNKDALVCLIGEERTSFSGSGKPGGRIHYHLVMSSALPHPKATISDLWCKPRYGGTRTQGAAANVKDYDPTRGAIRYLLKRMDTPGWDFNFHNLEYLSVQTPKSAEHNSRERRKLLRFKDRSLEGYVLLGDNFCPIGTTGPGGQEMAM